MCTSLGRVSWESKNMLCECIHIQIRRFRNARNRISAYAFSLAGGKGSGAYFQEKVYPGQWIMVAFVIDSRPSTGWPNGYIAIYKNGQLRRSRVSLAQFNVTPEASDAPFRVGTRDLESFFEEAIGKIAVYNSVLSEQDILATYNAMVPPGNS